MKAKYAIMSEEKLKEHIIEFYEEALFGNWFKNEVSFFGESKFLTAEELSKFVEVMHKSFKETNMNFVFYKNKSSVLLSLIKQTKAGNFIDKFKHLFGSKEPIHMNVAGFGFPILHIYEYLFKDELKLNIVFGMYIAMYVVRHDGEFNEEKMKRKSINFAIRMIDRNKALWLEN